MVDVKHTAGHAGARRVKLFRVPRRPARAAEEAGAPLVPAGERRKRKMAVARLGGGAGGRRRLFGAFRRLRVRWLAALYRRSLRRLRAYYAKAVQDLLEGAAAMSTLRSQAAADCSFGTAFAPVVAVGY
ncbi:uncharacterized protein [Oryza sativa Japonica Group]|jgi:hypothetical protein|uniref:Os02g0779300 protein n=6 Tax=Oryza TaxID=4527 RepID=Q0DX22_ORYSJ|nr:uncharacterized protein LOC4330917 [Oryza sativa Japonica Group]XP_052144859.1 uncharacterized protein LOC127764075 [Oryza glaberrima]KAB8089170.1 hypothetical protein EE612_014027 [Oryza sativa]EAZ24821.1 hypothetical protein OsJ_08599 [Oryza sativa Japonica Group]KAF2947248.1 hypothetical protein DAI22_02g355500 [Oryza sativa Japonica Group]BAD19518.1 unknown protein [Oryza sativa Japonica Group]BAF10216.1 Os02g0779300 [Oryza sativa Japonica Group]|eukprot:NP_001048302.1 Os02g0779300 [Oryza sativa Japonica Group]